MILILLTALCCPVADSMARPSRIVVSGYLHLVTQRAVPLMDGFPSHWERREYLWMLGGEIVRTGVSILA